MNTIAILLMLGFVAINANAKEVFRYKDEETKQSQFMEGEPGTSVNGGWKFAAPEGLTYELEYVADNNGFQPKANHIPLPIEDTNEVAEAKAEFLSRFKSAKNKEPINGAWEFESPEGMTYKLSYTADQLGGFLAEANHIPVQVDDTEEVKAAKDEFYKVFEETSAKLKALHKETEINIPKLEQESPEEHNGPTIIEVRRRKRDDYGSENDEKDVLEYKDDDNLMVENKETMNYVPKYYNYKSHPFWQSYHHTNHTNHTTYHRDVVYPSVFATYPKTLSPTYYPSNAVYHPVIRSQAVISSPVYHPSAVQVTKTTVKIGDEIMDMTEETGEDVVVQTSGDQPSTDSDSETMPDVVISSSNEKDGEPQSEMDVQKVPTNPTGVPTYPASFRPSFHPVWSTPRFVFLPPSAYYPPIYNGYYPVNSVAKSKVCKDCKVANINNSPLLSNGVFSSFPVDQKDLKLGAIVA